nr:MAG TPA: hypothetical protein [Caudoviricetes sp.]
MPFFFLGLRRAIFRRFRGLFFTPPHGVKKCQKVPKNQKAKPLCPHSQAP